MASLPSSDVLKKICGLYNPELIGFTMAHISKLHEKSAANNVFPAFFHHGAETLTSLVAMFTIPSEIWFIIFKWFVSTYNH